MVDTDSSNYKEALDGDYFVKNWLGKFVGILVLEVAMREQRHVVSFVFV